MHSTTNGTSVLHLQRLNRETGKPAGDVYHVNPRYVLYWVADRAYPLREPGTVPCTRIELTTGGVLFVAEREHEVTALFEDASQ